MSKAQALAASIGGEATAGCADRMPHQTARTLELSANLEYNAASVLGPMEGLLCWSYGR